MSDHAQSTDEIKASFAAGYDLERELLGGGMSRVFLATERALNRKVVIKVLPPDLAAGVNKERFRREVQLAAQLQHPHIVPLYAAGSQGDLLYYTMPFIEGESLRHALHEKTRFTPREVLRVLHDVVDALGYAHERGVIHRDIKPGNVLRSGVHSVVTDFGVAKAISASMPAVGMTTSGMVVGSPAYMAPEQLAGDPNADHRVDLYAVGLLAYELLTGEGPFQASSPQETMAAQLTRTPAPLDKVRKDVPPALAALIMRCLAKRPDDRPQTAAALLAELDAVQVASGEYAAAASARRPWFALAAATVILGAVAVFQKIQAPPAVAPVGRDTVTISPAGPLLTRAESLMIAKAVEATIAGQRASKRLADSAAGVQNGRAAAAQASLTGDALKKMADSIRDEIQRAVFDSLARVQQAASSRGGPPGGPGDGRRGPGAFPDRGGRGASPQTRVLIDERAAGAAGAAGAAAGAGAAGRFNGISPDLDSLMRIIEMTGRTMRVGPLDPIQFAKRATTMGPPRRVVVTEPRITSRALEAVVPMGAALADSVRKAIGASKRFVLVPMDSVRAVLEKTRTIDDLAQQLNAEVFASISVSRTGSDSLIWQLTLRDQSAHGAYGLRSWTTKSAGSREPIIGLDTLLPRSVALLNEMDRAPRKPPPDDRPGGPLSKEAFDARAANLGPARRLIVWTHPPDRARPEVEAAGHLVAESMRKAFASNPRYVVLPTDETLNALAKTRDREEVSKVTRAELMVTLRGNVQRGDSVAWTATAWDLGAHRTYEQRTVNAGRVALGASAANADSLFRTASQALETLDRAPRRQP